MADSLLTLARSREIESLEHAWQQSLSDLGDLSTYQATLETLCSNDALGVALRLGTQLVDSLVAGGRRPDAITLCTSLFRAGAVSEGLARNLFELIQEEYGSAEWYPVALELSGMRADNLSSDAFEKFDRMRQYTVGNVLYHRAGWGEGVIERFDADRRELSVRFATGKQQDFPLTSALDSLRPLPADDLRAMRLCEPDELARLAKEEPATLIRKTVKMLRGTATSTQVKSVLVPDIVEQKKWATFWKRAKTAAAHDPWLQIEGSSTRPTFVLRKQPLSLADEAKRTLAHSAGLGEAIAVCRDYIGRGLDESAQEIIVELARERVETAIEKQNETHPHLLDGILFLEEHGASASMSAGEELRALLASGSADGSIDLRKIDDLSTQESKEHAVRLLHIALGERWADLCVEAITIVPDSILDTLIVELQESKRAAALASAWERVATYPRRHPILLYHLGRLYAEGVFDAEPAKPHIVTVARVMTTLTRTVSDDRKGDPVKNRLRTRLTSLLTGRRALLERSFEEVSRDDLAALLQIVERASEEFPQEVTDTILRAVARLHPDLTKKAERPFWENDDVIWVTSAGLARQREEYRVLVDEKIPANSKAIGNAAALGDLSENSEWEAAMEEQRNLTGRAQEMDTDLRRAKLLEDAQIPDGVAAPGTRVTFTELDSGTRRSYRLLGPWDCVEDDILNYRAPLAGALLGRKAGDDSALEGPEGSRAIRIDQVERIV